MSISEIKTNTPKWETKDKPQANDSYKIRQIIVKIMEYTHIHIHPWANSKQSNRNKVQYIDLAHNGKKKKLFTTSLVVQTVKRLSIMWETWVQSLGREDPLENEMAIHSSIIAWKIPWTEEPGRLQSMGSQRVGHNWVTSLSLSRTKLINGQTGKPN